MMRGFFCRAILCSLPLMSFSYLLPASSPGEEPRGPDPEGLRDAFEIPAGDKDAYGNPIRKGTDAKSGLPLEIRHKATGMQLVLIPRAALTWGRIMATTVVQSRCTGEPAALLLE
ncbi:MAG: hypothetical protein HYU36_13700 [Planctomycetes bacterium]|nr:hypothetical protein [Planctomycetota bacterium]